MHGIVPQGKHQNIPIPGVFPWDDVGEAQKMIPHGLLLVLGQGCGIFRVQGQGRGAGPHGGCRPHNQSITVTPHPSQRRPMMKRGALPRAQGV